MQANFGAAGAGCLMFAVESQRQLVGPGICQAAGDSGAGAAQADRLAIDAVWLLIAPAEAGSQGDIAIGGKADAGLQQQIAARLWAPASRGRL